MKKSQPIGYKFQVKDPIGNIVVLRVDTFEDHIIGNHSSSDSEAREKALKYVPGIIESPELIYYDSSGPGRIRYIGLINDPEASHILALTVIADPDKNPTEVVTYLLKRNLNQEKKTLNSVMYDRRQHKKKSRNKA